jgi:hypothetical protein
MLAQGKYVLGQESLSTMSASYGNSIEALHDVINSYSISEITANLSYLANGVEYSFVEVTCNDGIQYGLQAYGKEALELNKIAFQELLKISLKNKK